MNDIRIFYGKQVRPDQQTVMNILECKEDSPVYSEMQETYEQLLEEVQNRIQPKAAAAFDVIKEGIGKLSKNTEILYCVMTIGDNISAYSRKFFDEGDYVRGMLVDAMADSCLFAMEKEIFEQIKDMCREKQKGICHRYEAPLDIPMQMQKMAFDVVDAKNTLGLSITSGYMYNPVKSYCQVFKLTDNTSEFHMEHDCSRCDQFNCPMREKEKISVQIQSAKKGQLFLAPRNSNLLEVLFQNNIVLPTPCGGHGKCGKCRIQLMQGTLEITKEDEMFFTEKELDSGMRLACMAVVKSDICIVLKEQDESQFQVLGADEENEKQAQDLEYGFAIDVGTTTLAISLIGMTSKKTLHTYTVINHQREFGADVIARMQASNTGKKEELKKSIQKDLETGMLTLIERYEVLSHQIVRITIAGNTTMLHLLRGYSCETLGTYPFEAVSLTLEDLSYKDVFQRNTFDQACVILLPSTTTFVGADITAGIYVCDIFQSETVSILIDLGTNGEMAIGNKDKILVTSTAAGPAFEGGNIEWGIGSIPGAICNVKIQENQTIVKTIQEEAAVGICGTGVIEIVAELVEQSIVDDTGMMEEPYFTEGYPIADNAQGEKIVFTQKDVREIQLAKAAVRAGLETLMLRFGVSYLDIDRVYIAGGFGYHMDLKKAITIGMLPKELESKMIAAGNTSLAGASRFLHRKQDETILKEIAQNTKEISLSMDQKFQEYYMEYMFY
ncbi:MAG: ASKHA domain-containing protein [Lachnotalea sp.]